MTYAVHTPVYEGPLELLLHLILQEQVDLYELSICDLVDAYVAEIENIGALDLEVATGFLLVAATLVELKSRRLLPGAGEVDLDEETALLDGRDLLLARLLEGKTFRDVGAELDRRMAIAGRSHPRVAGLEDRFLSLAPDLLAGIGPAQLRAAFLRAVAVPVPPPPIDLDHVAPIRVSVSDAVEELARTLPVHGTITFRRLTTGIDDRLEVIVRFLAVLELCKQGVVELRQAFTFGTLEVAWLADRASLASAGLDPYEG